MATEETLKTGKERNNPLFYLFGKTWHYSEGNRKNIVLYWFMFIIANAITLIFHPLVMAKDHEHHSKRRHHWRKHHSSC